MSNNGSRKLSSVTNALRVLRVLAAHPGGVGVTQLSQILGIGKSSAHLLLATLSDEDFVVQAGDGRYQLGLGAFEVGAAAGGVASAGGPLTPELRALADRCGEAVSLASASGPDAIIVQRVESVSILRAEIHVGTRMPLHASASGKYLLATMPEERLERLFPSEQLPRVTPHTVQTKTVLREQLAEARTRGYARNDDEYTVGISGVATGVVDATGAVVFALSIAGPTHRFRPEEWVEDLTETASRMSEILRGLAPVVLNADAERVTDKAGSTSGGLR